MLYNFYFDETFHDRKITINPSGVLNTLGEDKNDSYIGVFWGIESDKRDLIVPKLCELEQSYIDRYSLSGEFKSTTIKKKNFMYGIRSFNRDAFDFYCDFFALLEDISPIIHVNTVSKIEFLIRHIFDEHILKEIPGVIPSAFYYSITKFFITYHSEKLIQALYASLRSEDYELFKKELLNHIVKVAFAIEGIERKEREISALMQLFIIIFQYSFNNLCNEKYDFIYYQNFMGITELLKEKGILPGEVSITIDKEECTYNTAVQFAFGEVKQIDSSKSIEIRCTDHLCGFIGRMMYALMNDKQILEDPVLDINHLDENDLFRKRLLSSKWFDLEPKHLSLYKRIYRVLIIQQTAYWAAQTWSYADQVSIFYTLLRYFASFDSFESFTKYSPEEHAEYFNTACCKELERYYSEFYDETLRNT